jgi:hypothetical protein
VAGRFFGRSRGALARLALWICDGFLIRVGDELYPCNPFLTPVVGCGKSQGMSGTGGLRLVATVGSRTEALDEPMDLQTTQ